MNILYVSGCFDMGGTEVYTLNFAKGMMQAGNQVYWATKDNGLMRKEAEKQKISLLSWQLNRKNPISILRCMARIRTIIEEKNIDLVHFADAFPALVCAIALRRMEGRPVMIWSNVGIGTGSYGMMFKLCGEDFDCILAVSQYIRNRMIEVGFAPERIKVHVGTRALEQPKKDRKTLRSEYGVEDGDLLIGTVGRIVKMKGNHVLVQALPHILKTIPGAKLMLVGDGPEREALLELAESLGVGKRVIITGFQNDIANYYNAFDIVAFPTLLEALGYIPMEAWYYQKPLVASYTGGVPEIVIDGHNGLLASPGVPEEWAEKLIRLIKDEALQEMLVKNGKQYYENNMIYERSISLLEQIYDELINSREKS